MRFRPNKYLCFLLVLFMVVSIKCYLYLRLSVSFFYPSTPRYRPVGNKTSKQFEKPIVDSITIILREFELHENDVTLTAHSFMYLHPTLQILILYDELPYPPLDIMLTNNSITNVKCIKLVPHLRSSFYDHYPLGQIMTKYVLIVPDSTRITSRQTLNIMGNELSKSPGSIIAAPVNGQKKEFKCLRINMNVREWTLKFSLINALECDGVAGKHVMLMETEILNQLANAFILPFPHSFFIQTAVLDKKVKLVKGLSFHDGKPILHAHHAHWRQKQVESSRLKSLYNYFNIKQVVRETGVTEWYGCTKETQRCFSPVIDSMPSYLYEKRWTPPCCLANLRKTAKHTLNMLDDSGVRYWLEAGSLLGAMRSGDVLPWDHDVDIGFIREDLFRCEWLKKSRDKPVIDPKGFLWEKATEGNFYRVHFSKINRIYVNLFPFYTKNGTMMRDSWFSSHKHMEFPENFLHPMSSIEFIGRSVPSPNNIRDFLEMKFGKGSIENPEYPDSSKLKFP